MSDDLTKTRALFRVIGETDGSVTLKGEAATRVADALDELERLRTAAAKTVNAQERYGPRAVEHRVRLLRAELSR